MLPSPPNPPAVDVLVEAARSMNGPALRAALRAQAAEHGVDRTVTEIVLPFLREVGRGWECGDLTVAQEHFASQAVRGHLLADALGDELLGGRREAPIVLACPPGERHDLGLLCFHVLLSRAGVPTRFLGSDTPLKGLVDVCRLVGASGVVVAATRPRAFEVRAGALRVLGTRIPLGIGGAGATPELAERVGAHFLSADMAESVREVREWYARSSSAA